MPISTHGDFDLAAVESAGGWWMGTPSDPAGDFSGNGGSPDWDARIRQQLLPAPHEHNPGCTLAGWDDRCRVLAEVATRFRANLELRVAESRNYPDTSLSIEAVARGLFPFLSRCVPTEYERLRALIPSDQATGLVAWGQDCILIIAPANVTVAGIDGIQQALLAGCRRILIRLPREGASVLVDYCRVLNRTSPELGRRILFFRWPTDAAWSPLLRQIPTIAYGGVRSLEAIQGQLTTSHQSFHGHQVGVVLGWGIPSPEHLRHLGQSVIVHEQRGCLSPRLVLLGGLTRTGFDGAIQALSWELDGDHREAPGTTLEEQATVARRRDLIWIRSAQNRVDGLEVSNEGYLVSPQGYGGIEWQWLGEGAIRVNDLERIREGLSHAQGRSLLVVGLGNMQPTLVAEHLLGILGADPISCLGYLGDSQGLAIQVAGDWSALSPGLRPIPRICPVGSMQDPDLSHPLDGRPPLWDYLRFIQTQDF